MKIKSIFYIVIAGVIVIGFPTAGYSLDAREMILQNKTLYDQMSTKYEKAILSTCRYEQKNGKVSCIESPRVKEYESVTKYYSKTGENGKRELKNVRIILTPKSEQGLGMLNFGYQSNDKDDDNWVYFSSLGKVRRITSSDKNRNEPQSGSIFGSEYSSEDMTSTPIDDYTYKIIKTMTLKDRKTCVIEQIPSADRLRKSNYSKILYWLDLERKTFPKIVKYNRQGQAFKLFTTTHWKKIDDIWMPERQSVINLLSKRKTSLVMDQYKINIAIDNENYFSQRILLDEVFRGRFFQNIKKAL